MIMKVPPSCRTTMNHCLSLTTSDRREQNVQPEPDQVRTSSATPQIHNDSARFYKETEQLKKPVKCGW